MLDITTLAAWGEFLGGIAVIASLIYLAGQIRMNTKTVRASNFGDLLTVNAEFAFITTDPEVASLYLRGLDDFVGLSVEETAYSLGVSERTVKGDWRVAKAWLRDRLGESSRN